MKIKYSLFLVASSLMLTLSVFTQALSAQTYDWGNVAIGGGGFVSAVIPSTSEQNLVYVRTDVGGAYRWDHPNGRWIPLVDWVSEDQTGFTGIESLALDPQHPNRLYMQAGISYFNNGRSVIMKSDDYGETFELIDVTNQFKVHGNGMGRQTGEKLQVDPVNSNVLYTGTRWNGLFRSTDAGQTWSRVNALNVTTTPNENGISFVLLDPSNVAGGNTQTIFVGVSRFTSDGPNFYRSDDGGSTFTAVSGGPTANMPQRAALASDGNLYITYANGAGPHGHWAVPEPMDSGAVWKYNTATGQWTNVTPDGFTRGFGGISVDPYNPNRLVLSTINTWMQQGTNGPYGDRILTSTNGGASWVDVIARGFSMNANDVSWINGHAIHWTGSIEFDPFDTSRVWVTSGNGVFKTENIDANTTVWDFTVKDLEETVPLGLISIPDGPLISVIHDYDGFRHTDPSQYAPIHQPRTGSTTGLDYARQNPNVVVRVGNSMFYSADMGLSWTETGSINGSKGQVAVSANGSVILHSPENSNSTYLSTSMGSSWSNVSGLNVNSAHPAADPVNTNKFYAYDTNGRMLVSTNGGASFSQASSLAGGGNKRLALAPDREGDVWVALYDGGLARSTNSGASFSAINGVNHAGAVGFGRAAAGSNYPTVYIWGEVNNGTRGIYRSTDTGATWTRINDDMHQYGGPANGKFVIGDMNTFGHVYMSTAGRGIVHGQPTDGGTNGNGNGGGDNGNGNGNGSGDNGNGNGHGCQAPAWDAGATYNPGDIVSHSEHDWRWDHNRSANSNGAPGTSGKWVNRWTDLGPCL